jgi:two-component system OmpR family sensor kinase
VSARITGTTAVLEVADEGPGLDAADAARVFERFYRVDASRSRERGGSGLGLAVVAALVAAHGGQVEVDSARGEGATFRVSLPLAPTPPEPPGRPDPPEEQAEVAPEAIDTEPVPARATRSSDR